MSKLRIDAYYLFYGVTFLGTALTSVASFLMAEQVFGSNGSVGITLAVKTAALALMAPAVTRWCQRNSIGFSLVLSQLIGPLTVLPLFVGVHFNIQPLFLLGIALAGLPGLVLASSGTTYLRLRAASRLGRFRRDQGSIQLISGWVFLFAAGTTPWLIRWVDYKTILLLDVVTYAVGLAFAIIFRRNIDRVEPRLGTVPAAESLSATSTNHWYPLTTITVAAIFSATLMRGLPPVLSGSTSVGSNFDFDLTSRQSLWAFEALANIMAGLIYRRAYKRLVDRYIFNLGLLSAGWLVFLFALPMYPVVASVIFLMSTTMLLTFMKVRDDFIGSFADKASVLKATTVVNVCVNVTLTASPLLIVGTTSLVGFRGACLSAFVLQILLFLLIHFLLRKWRSNELLVQVRPSVGG